MPDPTKVPDYFSMATDPVDNNEAPDYFAEATGEEIPDYFSEATKADGAWDVFKTSAKAAYQDIIGGLQYGVGDALKSIPGLELTALDAFSKSKDRSVNSEGLRSTLSPEQQDSWTALFGSAAVSIVPTLGGMGLSLVGAPEIGAPLAQVGFAGLAGSTYGSSLKEYDEYKHSLGEEPDAAERYSVAITNAAIEYASERLGVAGDWMKAINRAGKPVIKTGVKESVDVGKEIIHKYAKSNPSKYQKLVKTIARGAASEGASEALAELSQGAITNWYKEVEDRQDFKSLFDGAWKAGVIGAGMGAGIGPLSYRVQNQADRQRRESNGVVRLGKLDNDSVEIISRKPSKDGKETMLTVMYPDGYVKDVPESQLGETVDLSPDQFYNVLKGKSDENTAIEQSRIEQEKAQKDAVNQKIDEDFGRFAFDDGQGNQMVTTAKYNNIPVFVVGQATDANSVYIVDSASGGSTPQMVDVSRLTEQETIPLDEIRAGILGPLANTPNEVGIPPQVGEEIEFGNLGIGRIIAYDPRSGEATVEFGDAESENQNHQQITRNEIEAYRAQQEVKSPDAVAVEAKEAAKGYDEEGNPTEVVEDYPIDQSVGTTQTTEFELEKETIPALMTEQGFELEKTGLTNKSATQLANEINETYPNAEAVVENRTAPGVGSKADFRVIVKERTDDGTNQGGELSEQDKKPTNSTTKRGDKPEGLSVIDGKSSSEVNQADSRTIPVNDQKGAGTESQTGASKNNVQSKIKEDDNTITTTKDDGVRQGTREQADNRRGVSGTDEQSSSGVSGSEQGGRDTGDGGTPDDRAVSSSRVNKDQSVPEQGGKKQTSKTETPADQQQGAKSKDGRNKKEKKGVSDEESGTRDSSLGDANKSGEVTTADSSLVDYTQSDIKEGKPQKSDAKTYKDQQPSRTKKDERAKVDDKPKSKSKKPDRKTRSYNELSKDEQSKVDQLVGEYIEAKDQRPDLTNIDKAINEYRPSTTNASFREFNDRNNITDGLAKSYLRKNARSLDVQAQEINDQFFGGNETVTPEDIAQFMVNNPNGPDELGNTAREIAKEYKEITGKNLNIRSAKSIAEKYGIKESEVQAMVNDETFQSFADDFLNSDWEAVIDKLDNDPEFFTLFPGDFSPEDIVNLRDYAESQRTAETRERGQDAGENEGNTRFQKESREKQINDAISQSIPQIPHLKGTDETNFASRYLKPFVAENKARVEKSVNDVLKKYKQIKKEDVKVWESILDFQMAYPKQLLSQPHKISGMYHDGKIHIIASHPKFSSGKVLDTLLHEGVGHYGLRRMFGINNSVKEIENMSDAEFEAFRDRQDEFNNFIDSVYDKYLDDPRFLSIAKSYYPDQYRSLVTSKIPDTVTNHAEFLTWIKANESKIDQEFLDNLSTQQSRVVTEEIVAHEVEKDVDEFRDKSLLDKLVEFLRKAWKNLTGTNLDLSTDEIRQIISASKKFLQTGDIFIPKFELQPVPGVSDVETEFDGTRYQRDNIEKITKFEDYADERGNQEIREGGLESKTRDAFKNAHSYIGRGIEAVGKDQQIALQHKNAKEYAKANNLWVDDLSDLGTVTDFGGMENQVVINPGKGEIYKSNNLFLSKGDILGHINYIQRHNYLFPETAYELVGFQEVMKNKEPWIKPIVKQKFITGEGVRKATQEEIDAYMRSRGYYSNGRKSFSYENGEFEISDLKPANVLYKEGRIFVIDDISKRFSQEDTRFQLSPPTDSEAFKKWFGDSKVVDENGEPLVVYHGTQSKFTEFRRDLLGSVTPGEFTSAQYAFFFTADHDTADLYSKGFFSNTWGDQEGYIMPVYLKIDNPFYYEENNENDRIYALNKANIDGHDGVIFTEDGKPVNFGVFNPNQIKSAIGNRGTYDPNNADIRFQIAPPVESTAFAKWKGDAKEYEGSEIQDVKSGEKVMLKVYHGTTNEFYEFDSSVKGNIEGHLGKINYFTSDYMDASENYQSTGADLTSRIENLRERVEQDLEDVDFDGLEDQELQDAISDVLSENYPDFDTGSLDFNMTLDEVAGRVADSALQGGDEKVMELYVKLNNPLVLGNKSTWYDTIPLEEYEDYIEDAEQEIADEYGVEVDEAKEDYEYEIRDRAIELAGIWENRIVEAMSDALSANGYDSGMVSEVLGEASYESEVDLNDLEKRLRSGDVQLYDNDEGELASSQVIADFFKNLGYDGIILTDVSERFTQLMAGFGDEVSHIHVFDEFNNQIKLASGENTTFDEGTSDIRFQRSEYNPADNFYSNSLKAVANISQPKATADQWRSMLLKNGASEQELKWIGFDQYISQFEGKSIPKDNILDFLAENQVEVTEVVKGEISSVTEGNVKGVRFKDFGSGSYVVEFGNDIGDIEISTMEAQDEEEAIQVALDRANYDNSGKIEAKTKYSQYTLPGGENYKELLLTLPNTERYVLQQRKDGAWQAIDTQTGEPAKYKTGVEMSAYVDKTDGEYLVKDLNKKEGNQAYKSSHWDEPNILSHIRFNERFVDGNKTLFIEEIQSDHAQDLRRGKTEIPMPFPRTQDWLNLSIRRMIRYASENGFDRIAFVTGQQSADRYDLSKQVDEIQYEPQGNGTYDVDIIKEGNAFISKYGQTESQLEELVGKEIAQKILNKEGEDNQSDIYKDLISGGRRGKAYSKPRQMSQGGVSWFVKDESGKEYGTWPDEDSANREAERFNKDYIDNPYGPKKLSGLDLKVGGEGMINFYDKIVPNTAKKLLRKLDKTAKVEVVRLESEYRLLEMEGIYEVYSNKENRVVRSFDKKEEAEKYITKNDDLSSEQLSFPITPRIRQTAIEEGMPLFQRVDTVQETPGQFTKKHDNWVAKWQDRMIYMRRLQELKYSDKQIADELNVYDRENLSKGIIKEQMRVFKEDYWKPLDKTLNEISKEGVSVNESSRYLKAKHIVEDNIEKGGIPMEEARQIVNDFESRTKNADKLREHITKINQFILDKRLESGLISKDAHDQLMTQFKFYVPLRGFNEAEADPTIFTKDYKRKGRTSESGDPMGYLGAMAQTAIQKGEQNKVLQGLYRFVVENPDSRIYTIKTAFYLKDKETGKLVDVMHSRPTKQQFEEYDISMTDPSIDDEAAYDLYRQKTAFERENITVKLNGKTVTIEFVGQDGKKLAEAIKGQSLEKAPSWISWIGQYTRTLRKWYTQYSPEFAIRNFIRDTFTGLINVRTDYGINTSLEVAGSIPKSMGTLFNWVKTGDYNLKSEDGRLLKEFVESGAQTGWSDLKSVEEYRKELEKSIKISQGEMNGFDRAKGMTKDGLNKVLGVINKANEMFENTTRFAAYKTLRKKGVSPQQAAIYAKDLTVNFNRKGNISDSIGTFYLFFNASMQGVERLTRPFIRGTREQKTRAYTQALLTLPAIHVALSLLNKMWWDKDEDGEYYYDKLPEYIRTHNLTVPNFFSDKPGTFLHIPLPYGFNVMFTWPEMVMAAAEGRVGPAEAVIKTAASVSESFSPLGSPNFDGMTPWESMMQYFAPTAGKPIVDVAINKNFMGTPIYKEPYPGQTPEPDSQMFFTSVNPIIRSMTDTLNAWTGGDEIQPGYVDVNPEVIEHFITSWTGGVGKFISNSVTTGMNASKGKNPVSYEDNRVSKTPFARNYTSQIPDYYYQFKFYELVDEVETKKDLFDRYRKSGNRENAKNYREANKDYLRLAGTAKDYNNSLKELRNRKKALEALGRQVEADRIDDKMNELYRKYIKLHNAKVGNETIDWREFFGFN